MEIQLLSEAEIATIRWGADSLIPAIVQDACTLQVLMLAYMNEAALRETHAARRGGLLEPQPPSALAQRRDLR